MDTSDPVATRAARALERRILGCLPAGTHALETLVRVAGIAVTREVQSAAVECRARPRLLVNPDFVERWCRRDEHLFLLVMHELWHVLLAHTRLYPRATPAANVAFDAVINATLARMFPGPEFRGFFEALYRPDVFPELLLRPPEDWTHTPRYPERAGPPGTAALLRRLYPPPRAQRTPMPLHSELLELLAPLDAGRAASAGPADPGDAGAPAPGPAAPGGAGASDGVPELLGDHSSRDADLAAARDPVFAELARRMGARWAGIHDSLRGCGPGDVLREVCVPEADASREVARAFRRVVERAASGRRVRSSDERWRAIEVMGGPGALPEPRDRRWPARRALLGTSLLWAQPARLLVRERLLEPRAAVYLDVSGSMRRVLPALLAVLDGPERRGEIELFQFSTTVTPLERDALRERRVTTTGGTRVDCVLAHWLSRPAPRSAVLLTDGIFVPPPPELLRPLEGAGRALHVVLPAGSGRPHGVVGLGALARTVTELPA